MPPRDEKEYESRRQQIMEGALEVFSTKGFERATNKEIARTAGIGSPGLIYHYFEDKRHLLQSLIEERLQHIRLVVDDDRLLDEPPRVVLPHLANTFLETVENRGVMALLRVLLGESMRRPAIAEMIGRLGPQKGLTFLRRYFERQIALGRLREVDPGAAARTFVGPLVVYILTREVFRQVDSESLERETMVETLVDVFLRGLEIEEAAPPDRG